MMEVSHVDLCICKHPRGRIHLTKAKTPGRESRVTETDLLVKLHEGVFRKTGECWRLQTDTAA